MKIIKKSFESIKREDAHSGSGGRKVFISDNELESEKFQAMTYGYIPVGSKYSWHNHEGIEEIMLVIKGSGIVRDRDGEYMYKDGDLFIYPQNVEHEIENTGIEENEFIFVRIKV
ncbi:MAG: cupin domain-containing protein [Ignavibacteriales bacterium]